MNPNFSDMYNSLTPTPNTSASLPPGAAPPAAPVCGFGFTERPSASPPSPGGIQIGAPYPGLWHARPVF